MWQIRGVIVCGHSAAPCKCQVFGIICPACNADCPYPFLDKHAHPLKTCTRGQFRQKDFAIMVMVVLLCASVEKLCCGNRLKKNAQKSTLVLDEKVIRTSDPSLQEK